MDFLARVVARYLFTEEKNKPNRRESGHVISGSSPHVETDSFEQADRFVDRIPTALVDKRK